MRDKEEETRDAIDAIYTGELASSIKKRTQYVTTGIGVGAVIGFILAGLMGKSKLIFAVSGAGAGALIGYVSSPKQDK